MLTLHRDNQAQTTFEAIAFIIAVALAIMAMFPYIREGMAFHFKRASDSVSGYMPYAQ
jgi:hypothetical protein